jgi:hypothetical protein
MLIDDLRYYALQHLRFKMQFPLVAMEVDWSPGVGYVMADVMGISKRGLLYEIEIKVSRSDLYADKGKEEKHLCLNRTYSAKHPECGVQYTGDRPQPAPGSSYWKLTRVPARFYYLVHDTMRPAALGYIRQEAPYAGLLVFGARVLKVQKVAPTLHNEIVPNDEQWAFVRAQSATLVRLAGRLRK